MSRIRALFKRSADARVYTARRFQEIEINNINSLQLAVTEEYCPLRQPRADFNPATPNCLIRFGGMLFAVPIEGDGRLFQGRMDALRGHHLFQVSQVQAVGPVSSSALRIRSVQA